MGELPEGLLARLGEAGPVELLHLVERYGDELDPAAVGQLLRNPHGGDEAVRAILARPRLLALYDVRRQLALHPRTPQPRALQLLSGLYWRDLVAVGLDTRLPPAVRRAADQRLIERLPGVAIGEKVAVARRASRRVAEALRHDPTPRVVGALLENPRLTEGVVLPLASSERAAPAVLALLADDARWGSRYSIRVAIGRNPRTPMATALKLLPLLKKSDLRLLVREKRAAEPVVRKARLLLGDLAV